MSTEERRVRTTYFSEKEIGHIASNPEDFSEKTLSDLFSYLRWGKYIKSPYVNSYNIKKRSGVKYKRPFYYCNETCSEFNCCTNTIFHKSKMSLAKTLRIIV